jgi:5-methylcytosine-specific restriction protein B
LANAQNSWAFAYAADRELTDVPILWRVAREAVDKNWRTFDQNLFNEALGISQMGLARMTMSLFWMKPRAYLSLDKNTRAYFENSGIVCDSKTASGYVTWLEKVVAKAGDDFPQISHDAYLACSGNESSEASADDDGQPLVFQETAPQNSKRRYWLYSPGEQARFWQECLDKGIIVIGYDELEDFHQYNSQEEIEKTLKEMWGKEERPYNHSRAVWEFAKVIQSGDVVIVKKGRSEYLGYGIVNGPCERDDSRPEFKSFRKVIWKKTGTWSADFDLVVKTLTDITKYPDYVVKLKNLIGIDTDSVFEPGSQTPSHSPEVTAYWWLNANPKIWDIRGAPIGTVNTYTTHNEAGNKRQKYKHFLAVKPGDLVLGYVTSPEKEIVALCQITKGLHATDEGEVIEFKKIEEFKQPVTWAELQSAPALKHCEPIESNQGSLFTVTEEEFDFIRSIIDERNLVTPPVKITAFTKADALAGLFMPETQLDLTLVRLKQKKALVLQGPPGVGKTFVAKRLAYALMGQKDDRRVSMVQFHPSYGYEDFIQGYRPSRGGGLERRDGVFYEFARLARNDPEHDWFFIIDEINRGNLAKIFGELLMLLEADKRGPDHVVSLTYSEKGEQFYLPRNLHVIGTMNTADRSLAMVDYALRRRFAFVTLEPAVNSTAFGDWLAAAGASEVLVEQIRAAVGVLNAAINKERDLGERFLIGHSFFCPGAGQKPDAQWYREIIQTEIKPLLEEYFDSKDHVENLIAEVLK